MKAKWILAGAIAFGLAGVVTPSFTFAKPTAAMKEMDEQIKYTSLPEVVKATVDKERGKHELKAVYHVMRDDKEFYRAVIDTKGDDTVIRIKPGGELMTSQDAKDVSDKEVSAKTAEKSEQVKYASLPAAVKETVDTERGKHELKSIFHVTRGNAMFYRVLIDEKGADREIRVSEGGKLLGEAAVADLGVKRAVVVATDESEGEEIDFDRCPGAVKAEIGKLAKADPVEQVIRYKHKGALWYRAEVGSGKYTRFIRVSEDAKMTALTGDIDPGKKVPFDRTPGAVKSKIGSLVKAGKVEEVIEYDRGGKTYYQAQAEDTKGKDYFVTVDSTGKEVDGLPK